MIVVFLNLVLTFLRENIYKEKINILYKKEIWEIKQEYETRMAKAGITLVKKALTELSNVLKNSKIWNIW